jgi:hypothetical protein
MKKILLLVLFVSMFTALANTAYGKKIELTDGSVLDGEIVSFSEGKYTVQNPSLGMLQIEASKVHSISESSAASSEETIPSDPAVVQSAMQRLQPAIMDNLDIMKTVVSLISSPDFRALVNDPEVMNAVKSLDVKTLMANPKFINAINNPAVKDIEQKLNERE